VSPVAREASAAVTPRPALKNIRLSDDMKPSCPEVVMLASKAAASRGMRQWLPRRMDIPANREDPAYLAAVHAM
jgi:hypothetical protein